MTVQEIVDALQLNVLNAADLSREIRDGYASDLLSCVMAGAKAGDVWVTLQAHPNVIAVALLLELSAVIITEDVTPDEETMRKARLESVNLLTATRDTFSVVSELAALGIKGAKAD